MSRTSHFTLIEGSGSGSRISPVPETDQEIITSLQSVFGKRLLLVKIGGRIIEVNK
jgi:hypothetical protein